MKTLRCSTAIAVTTALLAAGAPAQGEAVGGEKHILNTLTRFSTQYGLIALRTLVDLTYEHLGVDPRTGDVVITGLKVYPLVPWDQEGTCEVSFGRITRSDKIGFEVIDSRFEISGMTVAQSCFEPEQGAMMAAFGYDGLTVDSLAIDVTYEFASSAAEIVMHAAIRDAATITITAGFDYVWITIPVLDPNADGEDPVPVAQLSAAEVAVENHGIFERVESMLQAQLGDLAAVPQMVEAMLMDGLSEGGTRVPGDAERLFTQNLADELSRFLFERNRIVLSLAPPDGVWLDESLFATPTTAITALQPRVSMAPLSSRALVTAAELDAALSGQASPTDAEAALRVGSALLTGVGAPRSVIHGQALLMPLAEQWHPRAALLLAQALAEEGDAETAYRMALRAAAGGETRALATADQVEELLPTEAILAIQTEAASAWPGAADRGAADRALIETANISGMRERAQNAALGRKGPRNYGDAYYWASLAAAAGDRSSAGLRERLDRRFAGLKGAGRDAWKGIGRNAAESALRTWTEGGLGARVAEMYGVAQ